MKKLVLLITLLLSLSPVFGQTDTIHLTLKAKHLGFITAVAPNKADPEMVKVLNQAATQLVLTTDSLGNKRVADTAQLIGLVAKKSMVPTLFLTMGAQQERLSTNFNNEMRDMILKDLQRHPALYEEIWAIVQRNWADTWELVQHGFKYLITIKQ